MPLPQLSGTARQLQLCQRAAGEHLEGVMALSLVIRWPCSRERWHTTLQGAGRRGSKAKAAPDASFSPRAFSWEDEGGVKVAAGALTPPQRGTRGVSWLP